MTNIKDAFAPKSSRIFVDTLDEDLDPKDGSPLAGLFKMDHNSGNESVERNDGFPLEKSRESDDELPESDSISNISPPPTQDHNGAGDVIQISERNEDKIAEQTPEVAKSPSISLSDFGSPEKPEKTSSAKTIVQENEDAKVKKRFKEPITAVVSISKMSDMLLQSQVSYRPVKPQWPSTADQELLDAESRIRNVQIIEKDSHFDVHLYQNFSAFKR